MDTVDRRNFDGNRSCPFAGNMPGTDSPWCGSRANRRDSSGSIHPSVLHRILDVGVVPVCAASLYHSCAFAGEVDDSKMVF